MVLHLSSVLQAAKGHYSWLTPEHVLADKGYDSKECFRYVGEDVKAIPVIDVAKRRVGQQAREGRPCGAVPVITPDGVRYRCKRVPYDQKCPRFGKCPLLPVFVDGPLNPLTEQTYYERYSPFPYGSSEWKAVYNKRVSVERVFSRLKTYRKLDAIRVRRLAKVWLHVALSLLTMNMIGLANLQAGRASPRRCLT